ncbi:hypothetical protein KL86DYS2_10922 [uncultured Dysgonomonas sp.]|uniref:Uncharacterized protein n=1 Tax=uncultured Dysgonomonas sp. TaxID=206096 RepID=A0A212J7R5_9BACT|nr:hypothetical protein KL86DYS2_10922 [uncultured Dysgonomonas sp.]
MRAIYGGILGEPINKGNFYKKNAFFQSDKKLDEWKVLNTYPNPYFQYGTYLL